MDYKNSLNNLPIAIVELNAKAKVVYSNEKFKKLFNYEIEIFNNFESLFKILQTTSKEINDFILNIEVENQKRIFSINGNILLNESNKFNGIILSIDDITAKYQKEESLKEYKNNLQSLIELQQEELEEASKKLQIILDSAPVGIWMQNRDGRLEFVNRVFCDAVGISEEKFLSVPHYSELYDEESAKSCIKSDNEALEQDEIHISYEKVMFVDGKFHDLEIIKQKILNENGEIRGLIGISLDITEKKKIEEALKKSELEFRSTFEQAAVGIVNASLDGKFIKVNEKFCEIIGYSKDEVLNLKFQDITYPDDLKEDLEHLKEINMGEKRSFSMQKRYIHKNGSIVWINLSGSLVRDEENNPLYYIGVIEDITEKKNLQKALMEKQNELEKLNINLEEKVKDGVKKQREQEKLLIQQSKLASMGEMIHNISHQWRQPLNTVGLILQKFAMLNKRGKLTQNIIDGSVNKGMSLINEMSKVIDDFGNFINQNGNKVNFNIKREIENTIELFEASLKYYHIKIELRIDEKFKIYGCPSEFSQVVLTLINNAKDAILEKNVKDGIILIEAIKTDESIELSVLDNGGGIKEKLLDRVFEPYFTTKLDSKGIGLGLYMSKIIVEENMNGKLSVENIKDGVCFKITIPQKKESE